MKLRSLRHLIIFFSLGLTTVWATHPISPRAIIIDTDVGIDDVIAILYLLQQPSVQIKAITIESNGNAHCKPAFANIKKILQLTHHSDIPVACGRTKPLQGDHRFPGDIMLTCDTLAGISPLPSSVSLPKQTAKELIVDTLRSSSQTVDILAIGPLTTIAEVYDEQPKLKNKTRMIYAMGGAINTLGNLQDIDRKATNQVAEWNIYIDPLAAKKVFHSGVPITLVPLDVTNTVRIDTEFYKNIQQHQNTAAAKFVFELLDHNQPMLLNKIWYLWDPMAALIAMDESITTIERLPLSVLLHPESLSGATRVDDQHGASIKVCTKIQGKIVKKMLLKGLNNHYS